MQKTKLVNKKKKILYSSNFCKLSTGFGRHAREVLLYLHSTGKYDIVEYAHSPIIQNDPNTKSMPWKCYGALPEDESLRNKLAQDQGSYQSVRYGSFFIDEIIKNEKPDIYIGVEDYWAFNGFTSRPWWNKIHCIIWTTLDSLPLYPPAVKDAPDVKNFWMWANFATKEMHKLGHSHVKTVPAIINQKFFKKASQKERKTLRKNLNLEGQTVFGFVFRNQLRKLVGTLIEGFALFKKNNPVSRAKLLLHTSWSEGWDIPRLLQENGVDLADVLTSYVCRSCSVFRSMPFQGEGLDCPSCGAEKASHTASIDFGVSEDQMNMLYNAMDAYIHPVTSGGFEMPVLEAALVGLPIATVPYSCCEDYTECEEIDSLDFDFYREINTGFLKSQPKAKSIADFMEKVYFMDDSERKRKGDAISSWAKERYDNKKELENLEKFLDELPEVKFNFDFSRQLKDENYPMLEIDSDEEWIEDLYENMMNLPQPKGSKSVESFLEKIEDGVTREEIYKGFINEAKTFNSKHQKIEFKKDFDLPEGDNRKKLAYIMPKSLGDCFLSTAILDSMLESYPPEEWAYFVVSEKPYWDMFLHLSYIEKMVEYVPDRMDNFQWWEGSGGNKGLVDIAFQPYYLTQRMSCYNHNGMDTNELQEIKN